MKFKSNNFNYGTNSGLVVEKYLYFILSETLNPVVNFNTDLFTSDNNQHNNISSQVYRFLQNCEK